GCRTENNAPHAVSTSNEDVLGLGFTDERESVWSNGTRAYPLILTIVQIDIAESNTRVVNDGFNSAWDQWIIRISEFHGSRNAEATLVRSTCNPLLRQVDRVLDGLWRSHREGIATASLYRHLHAMVTHQIR